MTVFYQNTPKIIGLDKIKETIITFKEYFQKIEEKVNRLKNKVIEVAKDILLKHKEFNEEIKALKSLMVKISDLLEENPLFNKNEFIDFLMIQNMAEYILADFKVFMENAQFIDDLFIDYRNIILKKLENNLEGLEFNYEIEYGSYESLLYEKKEYFYLHIYQSDNSDDDLIAEFANALEGDGN